MTKIDWSKYSITAVVEAIQEVDMSDDDLYLEGIQSTERIMQIRINVASDGSQVAIFNTNHLDEKEITRKATDIIQDYEKGQVCGVTDDASKVAWEYNMYVNIDGTVYEEPITMLLIKEGSVFYETLCAGWQVVPRPLTQAEAEFHAQVIVDDYNATVRKPEQTPRTLVEVRPIVSLNKEKMEVDE
ncbi:hypothetical protein ACK8P5_26310 (plasmid) [Paenibacillus sp. EC2-1]|uniref:hypothetical protein n=1 Tax=Paenibacillus sp. EC2-1 TaxID=3388665 RepID=UPI003BEF4521